MSATRQIRLPALSATMEGATLLEWKVAPGDEVAEGEPIAEVSTDKVEMDLECPYAGVIEELLVAPGEIVPLGGVVATIVTEAEDLLGGLELGGPDGDVPIRPEPPLEAPPAPSAEAAASPIIPASPPARKLARELGVDLGDVSPTGARGQVTPADVKRFAEGRPAAVPAEEPSSPAPDDPRRMTVRRATAEIMSRSALIPQFSLWRTLVLDRAAIRKGGRSWTTVLVRALGGALRRHPELNARWDDETESSVPFDAVRIGLAVDRPGTGLVVASVVDPDLPDADAVDRAVRTVADRARLGKLRPEDLAQASVTLSNLGGFGVDRFTALLFPPQAAILSVGSIRARPIATPDGALKAALTCEVGLTVDHRVADGADGARFLESFAALAEEGD